MPTTWIINDISADPRYVKTVTPFTYTNQISQAKVYLTEAAAETDCATLNAQYPGRFWVGAHP